VYNKLMDVASVGIKMNHFGQIVCPQRTKEDLSGCI
jgi:hypothetical protein